MVAYCLADFFNLELFPVGREPEYLDIQEGLEDLVEVSLEACPTVSEMTFRLYGGWHGDIPATRITLRDLTARVADRFPRGTSPRVRIELAESPIWNRALRLLRTVQEWSLTHISASIDASMAPCAQPEECMVSHLQSWRKGRCPHGKCPVQLADVASTRNQKMVDTLLTADAITIGAEELADVILIASDDEDMIPALLSCLRFDLETILLSRRNGLPEYYSGIMALDGMATHTW